MDKVTLKAGSQRDLLSLVFLSLNMEMCSSASVNEKVGKEQFT